MRKGPTNLVDGYLFFVPFLPLPAYRKNQKTRMCECDLEFEKWRISLHKIVWSKNDVDTKEISFEGSLEVGRQPASNKRRGLSFQHPTSMFDSDFGRLRGYINQCWVGNICGNISSYVTLIPTYDVISLNISYPTLILM